MPGPQVQLQGHTLPQLSRRRRCSSEQGAGALRTQKLPHNCHHLGGHMQSPEFSNCTLTASEAFEGGF